MIRLTANSEGARNKIDRLIKETGPDAQERILSNEAATTFGRLVTATPKRWSGRTREGWKIAKAPGVRIIYNESPVMRYLEFGTRAHGPRTLYGPLQPGQKRRKAALFIPLTKKAAFADRSLFSPTTVNLNNRSRATFGPIQIKKAIIVRLGEKGRSQKLIYGVDYVLAKHVKGIKAMHIVEREKPLAKARLLSAFTDAARKANHG